MIAENHVVTSHRVFVLGEIANETIEGAELIYAGCSGRTSMAAGLSEHLTITLVGRATARLLRLRVALQESHDRRVALRPFYELF